MNVSLTVDLKTLKQDYVERSATVTAYLQDIRKFKILDKEEETALFNIIRHSQNQAEVSAAKEKIVNANQRFVLGCAKRYANGNAVLLLDLINEGNFGLIEAMDSFNETKGTSFISWASWYIRRAINTYLLNYGKIVKRTNEPLFKHKLAKVNSEFFQENQRLPTEEEIAEILETKYSITIKNAADLVSTNVIEIDGGDIDDDDSMNASNMMSFNKTSASLNGYESIAYHEHNVELVKSLLSKLSPKECEIIKYCFGIDMDRSYELQEVASKLGLTTERVRQVKIKSIEKLKELMKKGAVKG